MSEENFNENEQKLLNLSEDKEFQEQVIDLKDQEMSKEERIGKIKNILSEKGIDYTQEDAEFFESIISCVRNKKIKLDSENLKNVSGGEDIPFDQLPKDIQEKIIAKNPEIQKRLKIIAGVTIGATVLGIFGGGFGLGYYVGKKKGEKGDKKDK